MIAAARDFSRRQFEIAPILADLLAVERMTGKAPEKLKSMPSPPEGIEHLWRDWQELHRTREPGRWIRWQEMQAWAVVNSRPITPFEARVFRAFDEGYIQHLVEEAEDRKKQALNGH